MVEKEMVETDDGRDESREGAGRQRVRLQRRAFGAAGPAGARAKGQAAAGTGEAGTSEITRRGIRA